MSIEQTLDRAAASLGAAAGILVCAGAGMGVDSGLPDFRGDEGFWRAYPPLKKLGMSFPEMANPDWFSRDPALAWGFYGHRLHLYRDTIPHAGFGILRDIAPQASRFVFTSNVDGQFQRAGFDPGQICEVHGSIHHLQTHGDSDEGIWSADDVEVAIDRTCFRAVGPLPCSPTGRLARPNILMFGDWGWDDTRSRAQGERLDRWLHELGGGALVIIELGAGTAVPTVRNLSNRLLARRSSTLIRINPRASAGPAGTLMLPMGARDACTALDARLSGG
ncbi:MAG: Sir2 family NAD-dependent protein deacetylase [Myxococcota bacterium]|nr:Sir2 family NAD-dependent protein deacetylase [Myxococcota bacterium]MEC8423954.1 Sir2 family NAD-dependent protein deacetylase [Myxococcota bacterium]